MEEKATAIHAPILPTKVHGCSHVSLQESSLRWKGTLFYFLLSELNLRSMLSKKTNFCSNLHCKGDKLGKEARTECSLYYAPCRDKTGFCGRLTRKPIILDSVENTRSNVWANLLDSSDSFTSPREASGLGKRRFPKDRKAGM